MTPQELMEKSIRELQQALEMGLYYGELEERRKLRTLLYKLGVNSAKYSPTGWYEIKSEPLTIESLEDVLSKVTHSCGKP